MDWASSSRCEANKCVEVQMLGDVILVRPSTHPELQIAFTPDEWEAFIAGVKAGEFDL